MISVYVSLCYKYLCPTGGHQSDDNLLHLCLRQGLGDMVLQLLQPRHFAGKGHCLMQRTALDNRSPLELAHKHGLMKAAEVMEGLIAVSFTIL